MTRYVCAWLTRISRVGPPSRFAPLSLPSRFPSSPSPVIGRPAVGTETRPRASMPKRITGRIRRLRVCRASATGSAPRMDPMGRVRVGIHCV